MFVVCVLCFVFGALYFVFVFLCEFGPEVRRGETSKLAGIIKGLRT